VRVVLVYGPDRGLVSERARGFARATGLNLDDPFTVVKLDASAVTGDPGRLVDEARTVAMFADRRLIWLTDAGSDKGLAEAVRILASDPPRDSVVLIEAGDLKKGSPVRAAAEEGFAAMALPCYADDSKAIDRLIDEMLGAAQLRITMDARTLLAAALGGDRLASRGELEKLVLYCKDSGTVEAADVRAAIGDAASSGTDDAIDALMEGKGQDFDAAFARLASGGTPPFLLLSAAQRQFSSLQTLRNAMDGEGKSASAAVASARPPVFFARRQLVERALSSFDGPACARILDRLQASVLETRRRPDLARAITYQALVSIASERARPRR
jgi:DNA polymerase-3 subunit delta